MIDMQLFVLLSAFRSHSFVASAQVGSLINFGATIKDSLRLEGTHSRLPASAQLRWGEDPTGSPWMGTLQQRLHPSNRTWTLPDATGTILVSGTGQETDPVWTADKTGATTIRGSWTFSNTITGSINGNAAAATALQSAQNFALSGDVTAPAVPFDGTADVTLSATIANGAVSTAKLADGRTISGIPLRERGARGERLLSMRDDASGDYDYALVLDGRIVANRQLIFIK
jgi:hypothetical protein